MSSKLQMQMYPSPPLVETSSGQEWYYRRSTWHSAECNWESSGQSHVPPVEASGGQDQHYVRSTWHSAECNWEGRWQSDVPPSRGIWWSRAVLHQINLTFWRMQLRRQWTVTHEIWALEHSGIYVDWSVLLLLLLLLLNVVVLVVHLWLGNNNYSWTRTTTTLHSNNNTHHNKKIAQFM